MAHKWKLICLWNAIRQRSLRSFHATIGLFIIEINEEKKIKINEEKNVSFVDFFCSEIAANWMPLGKLNFGFAPIFNDVHRMRHLTSHIWSIWLFPFFSRDFSSTEADTELNFLLQLSTNSNTWYTMVHSMYYVWCWHRACLRSQYPHLWNVCNNRMSKLELIWNEICDTKKHHTRRYWKMIECIVAHVSNVNGMNTRKKRNPFK